MTDAPHPMRSALALHSRCPARYQSCDAARLHPGCHVTREDKHFMTRKTPAELRSARWFAPDDFRSFGHRSRMNQMGYAVEEFAGRPLQAARRGR
jgi:hypothetical protein